MLTRRTTAPFRHLESTVRSFRNVGAAPRRNLCALAVKDFPGVATSCVNAPTVSGQVNGKGFGQLNLDLNCVWPAKWTTSLGIYNLLATKAPGFAYRCR